MMRAISEGAIMACGTRIREGKPDTIICPKGRQCYHFRRSSRVLQKRRRGRDEAMDALLLVHRKALAQEIDYDHLC